MRVRLPQPAENLPADRVGKRFVDRVDIGFHLGFVQAIRQQAAGTPEGVDASASLHDEVYIVILRYA
jgi:hypothetical protein